MTQFRWIISGVLGGALYSLLVTVILARSYALAWPDWYAALFEGQSWVGLTLWNVLVAWIPCLFVAVTIGFILVRMARPSIGAAALIGTIVIFFYVVFESAARGFPYAVVDVNVLAVVAAFPLGVFLTELHNKSLNSDAGKAGAG